MASILEKLLEPQNLEIAVDSRWWVFGLSLSGAAAGTWLIWLIIRRMGQAGSGLNFSEAVLGLPLALAAFVLPAVLILALHQPLTGGPLANAIVQALVAAACIGGLANQPWLRDEPRGSWVRPKRNQLMWVPLLWLLGLPVMQLAMLSSTLLHELVGASIQTQEVVDDLRKGNSPGWIFAWYLMAVVAAPLMEEFVFRVVLFGGTRRLLEDISKGTGWRHPGTWFALIVSISAFVFAHGVWNWTVGIMPLTVLSVILTLLYAHTKSMWPGVLYHALHNSFVVTMQFYVL